MRAASFLTILIYLLSFRYETARASETNVAEPIRIQIGGEPSTLDPVRLIDQYGLGILRNVVEGLFKLDPEGRLAYGLATSHAVSKNGLQLKIKLRGDALWSDGRTVTAEECVAGLRRVLEQKTASPNADYFFAIKNARAVFEGKAAPETLGLSSLGNEIVIDLERPDPALPLALTLPAAGPVRKDVLAANKGAWSWKDPVTGDYVIKSYRPADLIELSVNPTRRLAGQRDITYRILSEEITAMNLFEAGKLDVITTITLTEIERYKKLGFVRVFPSTTVFYLSFNHSRQPLGGLKWRQAIASVIDRDGIARALNGAYLPVTSYLPSSLDGYLQVPGADFKEAVKAVRASTLLLEKKPRITLAFGASAFTKTVAEKLQHDIKEQLGVTLNLEPMELKTLLAKLQTDPPDMYFLGMSALYNDPLNQLKAFSSATSPNFAKYKSEAYEKLIDQIKIEPPGEKRRELAARANRMLLQDDVALVPVVLRQQVFGVAKGVTGFHVSPYQIIPLSALRK